jgi:hypothetical protein
MESLLFLTEERDRRIKGRLVYNGKPAREWLSKEDAESPRNFKMRVSTLLSRPRYYSTLGEKTSINPT